MAKVLFWLSSSLLFGCASVIANGPYTIIKSIQTLLIAVANAEPGKTIKLANGDYFLDRPLSLTTQGTVDQPIVIKTESGATRLVGKASIQINDSDWLTIKGFTLAHEARTMTISNSDNIYLSDLTLRYRLPTSGKDRTNARIHWLRFKDGIGHRIESSEFGPYPGGLGVIILINNTGKNIRIANNHFMIRREMAKMAQKSLD